MLKTAKPSYAVYDHTVSITRNQKILKTAKPTYHLHTQLSYEKDIKIKNKCCRGRINMFYKQYVVKNGFNFKFDPS